ETRAVCCPPAGAALRSATVRCCPQDLLLRTALRPGSYVTWKRRRSSKNGAPRNENRASAALPAHGGDGGVTRFASRRMPYFAAFSAMLQANATGVPLPPFSSCGVYSTVKSAKLRLTFSVRRSSPPEPPVV